jgi:hypothetical protein
MNFHALVFYPLEGLCADGNVHSTLFFVEQKNKYNTTFEVLTAMKIQQELLWGVHCRTVY